MIDVPALLDALSVRARRRGRDWWAPCPNDEHDERTPSWHIRDEPGARGHAGHYCFGCKWGGGPAELVMGAYGFAARSSAVAWIEDRGLDSDDVPPLDVELVVETPFRVPFSMPRECVTGPLAGWPTIIRRYVEGRGITAAQVRRWRVHYAVDGSWGGRVVFPFTDEQGVLRNISARSFVGHDRRYRTGAEEKGADPDALFGPRHWPADRRRVVITEGAVDALACERAGAEAVAALSGSDFSAENALLIGTFPEVVIATDPDGAGEAVALAMRGLSRWVRVRRATIPGGKDAASMPARQLRRALRCEDGRR